MTTLVIAAALVAGSVALLRAVLRDGPAFHDRLASFDEHTDQALAVVDGSLTDAERVVWHEIEAGYGRRGSIA